ncbi:MAG TPA: glutathione S-transferase family protein [Polyangiales bacterium]|jgi:glutathione S-transferase
MALVLYSHPLASYCHKVLIALYENETPFEARLVDLGDPNSRAEFDRLAPLAKMPVLRDLEREQVVTETSVIIEYLQLHHPGAARLLPSDAERALPIRALDRFYDLYVNEQMGKIVADHIRPADERDGFGVAAAKAMLHKAYGVIEAQMSERSWAAGDTFTMADCAAAPALFYAQRVASLADYPHAAAYLRRLCERPSFARVLREAKPYFKLFPVPSDLNA